MPSLSKQLLATVLVIALAVCAIAAADQRPPQGPGQGQGQRPPQGQGQQQQSPPRLTPEQEAAIKAACGTQVSSVCGEPSSQQFPKCVDDNMAKFSTDCAAALQAAKPPTKEQKDAAKAKFEEGCGTDVKTLCADMQQPASGSEADSQPRQLPAQGSQSDSQPQQPREDRNPIMKCLADNKDKVTETCKATLVYLIQHRPGANATIVASVNVNNVFDAPASSSSTSNDAMWFNNAQPTDEDAKDEGERGMRGLPWIIGGSVGGVVLIVASVLVVRTVRRRRAAAAAAAASTTTSGGSSGAALEEIVVAKPVSMSPRKVIPAPSAPLGKLEREHSDESVDSVSIQTGTARLV